MIWEDPLELNLHPYYCHQNLSSLIYKATWGGESWEKTTRNNSFMTSTNQCIVKNLNLFPEFPRVKHAAKRGFLKKHTTQLVRKPLAELLSWKPQPSNAIISSC